jgi:hypothetical protein
MGRFFHRKKMSVKRFGKDFLHLIKTSRLFQVTTVLSFLFLVCIWILPLWRIMPLAAEQPFIPLHYNIYIGIDRFGPWYHTLWLPGLGTILLGANILFETFFFQRERLLSVFFMIGTVLAELCLLVSMALIVLLNL